MSGEVALCQNGCGLIRLAELLPDENDPPGRCPRFGGQACNCEFCVPLGGTERGKGSSGETVGNA